MKGFEYYLDELSEIGYVREVNHSLVRVNGLPGARLGEVVIFESQDLGQVLSLTKQFVEVLLLSSVTSVVGAKVARTNRALEASVGEAYLGSLIDPLTNFVVADKSEEGKFELRAVDTEPLGLVGRENVTEPLETGVSIIDLVVPLGKGQRELVIGDRKTGKSAFLMQVARSQVEKGAICIYAAIGKRAYDIKVIHESMKSLQIDKNSLIIATASTDPTGLIFSTPFVAMTFAEYFRDIGKDVLVIMDDLTTHANFYREIALLGKRFPGRDSYPGDIFYVHSRLLERAGNFSKGSISCLPVAELVQSDLSGYIQTNLMAMTDGHIFFDSELFNQGKRPAANPFLSVTRVGQQSQTALLRDLSRQLSSLMVRLERMRQFMHFGAELSEISKKLLILGDRIDVFLNQSSEVIVPINVSIFIFSVLWAGFWQDIELDKVERVVNKVLKAYLDSPQIRTQIDDLVGSSHTFNALVFKIKKMQELINNFLKGI